MTWHFRAALIHVTNHHFSLKIVIKLHIGCQIPNNDIADINSLVWILSQGDRLSEFPLVVRQVRPLSCGQSQEGNLLRHKGNIRQQKDREDACCV